MNFKNWFLEEFGQGSCGVAGSGMEIAWDKEKKKKGKVIPRFNLEKGQSPVATKLDPGSDGGDSLTFNTELSWDGENLGV